MLFLDDDDYRYYTEQYVPGMLNPNWGVRPTSTSFAAPWLIKLFVERARRGFKALLRKGEKTIYHVGKRVRVFDDTQFLNPAYYVPNFGTGYAPSSFRHCTKRRRRAGYLG